MTQSPLSLYSSNSSTYLKLLYTCARIIGETLSIWNFNVFTIQDASQIIPHLSEVEKKANQWTEIQWGGSRWTIFITLQWQAMIWKMIYIPTFFFSILPKFWSRHYSFTTIICCQQVNYVKGFTMCDKVHSGLPFRIMGMDNFRAFPILLRPKSFL